ncbi:photosystem II S4 domain protein [cyanobacterium endosymbiont of Epithemia clementina EcSB]|uniref:photosystem II S4 domain protein n=1 Tax=cyanobacterium endosymbiont of Epithemia clementina EcSB TaxID=3034674 RepID=UPI0024802FC1|nr:photosystem II S4 domain protein [cyanobacterium endosymbiont of Epithemia clementina EcSB]WGT67497.1 photosystem II S4 domain protein [cyanobacterium endosymbiont of Epithemia clementina EcSB]
MLPREKLLKGIKNREAITRIVDQAEIALKTWEVVVSDFLCPPVIAEVQGLFKKLTEVEIVAWGGYPQAERQRVGIARPEISLNTSDIPLAALCVAGNFLFDPANHRDFLGAISGAGIVREKVGDIIVLGERGAQLIVAPEMAKFLEISLVQVRSVPVTTELITLSELKIHSPKTKTMTTVEASMRLDAIASAGFGMSRNKMANAINSGDVRVNWKDITQASHTVESGDLITVRGKGRLEVGEVAITRKQRYRIQLTRFQ